MVFPSLQHSNTSPPQIQIHFHLVTIYEHDALAWVLYQNQQYAEAKQASDKALERNTTKPAFHYHAGMIAKALGDSAAARQHLERALALNPNFDRKQAAKARAVISEASSEVSK